MVRPFIIMVQNSVLDPSFRCTARRSALPSRPSAIAGIDMHDAREALLPEPQMPKDAIVLEEHREGHILGSREPALDAAAFEDLLVQLEGTRGAPVRFFRGAFVREGAEPEDLLDEDPVEQHEEGAQDQDDAHAEHADAGAAGTTCFLAPAKVLALLVSWGR